MPKHNAARAAELDAIIARNALKYDLMPYNSNPFAQTIPARTSALAHLFGLDFVPVETARVLELGCASGGNIIPLAARYPKAHFVGVDLSRTQVAAGRARIAALELSNIEILCQSFTELQDNVGSFDYIICHGVYSWVHEPVRQAILKIAKERLTPDGIAYISYNVLPGWRMRQPLRDIFTMLVPDNNNTGASVKQAMNILEMLQASAGPGPYGDALKHTWQHLQKMPEDYIAHEYLEDVNDPCTFGDFVKAAENVGLSYLADNDLPMMILDNQPPEIVARIRATVSNSLVATEQMLDMISGRIFRQTMLVHTDKNARIERNLTPSRLSKLHLIAAADLKVEKDETGGRLVDSIGRTISTTSPVILTALTHILSYYPSSFTADDILAHLSDQERQELGESVLDAIFRMVLIGMLIPRTAPVTALSLSPDKPVADQLARSDALRGESSTANIRHERVMIDVVPRILLPIMDGTRDQTALAEHLVKEALEGRINFNAAGQEVSDEATIRRLALETTTATLGDMARMALLIANDSDQQTKAPDAESAQQTTAKKSANPKSTDKTKH